MPDAKGKIFFVGRLDGLGARLSSMLDAIWLADRFGGRFRFHWFNTAQSPQEPVIRPRTEVFSAAFLQAHHVDIAQFRSWTPRPLSGLPMPLEDALRPDSGIDCFSITWAPLRLQGPGLSALAAEGRDRRAAFDAIGFSPALERARRLAATVALPPGAAALHLRAGDVVHGPYRAGGGHHGRVISYPIALHILRQRAEAGVPMILFGQDAALCEHAKHAHGAVLAADLTAGLGFT